MLIGVKMFDALYWTCGANVEKMTKPVKTVNRHGKKIQVLLKGYPFCWGT